MAIAALPPHSTTRSQSENFDRGLRHSLTLWKDDAVANEEPKL
jgi:hypothetical protein